MIAIVLAAAFLAGWINYALVGATIITLVGTMYRTRGFIRGSEFQGQLEAKNEIIRTNEQALDSFRARVQALEEDFTRVTHQARVAQEEVERLRHEVQSLERYAAPEAVGRFQHTLDAHREELMARLKALEGKIDSITVS